MNNASRFRVPLLIASGLVVLVAVAMLLSGRPYPIEPGSTVVLEMGGAYVEGEITPIERLLGGGGESFVSILSRLSTVERDDRVGTLVLVIRPLEIGWGKADELRAALGRLKRRGRKVVALLDLQTFRATREFYVASAADELYMSRGSVMPLAGMAADYVFYHGLLERLGLKVDVGKAGKYKSAVEPFTRPDMSEASLEMANSLLDDVFERFVAAVAEGRGLDEDRVRALVDEGLVLSTDLEAAGLVDGSLHLDQLLDRVGGDVVRQKEYARVSPEDVGWDPEINVALIYGTGTVVSGKRSPGSGAGQEFASRTTADALRDAAEDSEIDAILLRIDSPGGSALAAEEIHRAIVLARESGKPIVASFSDLAASGGYYVAAAADSIVSSPGTLTGSIGVFSLRPVIGEALEGIGISLESLRRGANSDILSIAKPLRDGARARYESVALDIYQLFLARVAEGRPLEVDEVDAVAQGRVWTGEQAMVHRLVDQLGGLHAAVDQVRERLDVDEDTDVALVVYPKPMSLSQQIMGALDARVVATVRAQLPLPPAFARLDRLLASLPIDAPLMLLPFAIDIR